MRNKEIPTIKTEPFSSVVIGYALSSWIAIINCFIYFGYHLQPLVV